MSCRQARRNFVGLRGLWQAPWHRVGSPCPAHGIPPHATPSSDALQGSIQLTVEFIGIDKDPNWNQGVKGSGNNGAVPDVYFPMRKGCHVTLYNDAHVVSLLPSMSVKPQRCRSSQGMYVLLSRSSLLCMTVTVSLTPATEAAEGGRQKGQSWCQWSCSEHAAPHPLGWPHTWCCPRTAGPPTCTPWQPVAHGVSLLVLI